MMLLKIFLVLILFISVNFAWAEDLVNWDKDSFFKADPGFERAEILGFIVDQFKKLKNPQVSQKDLDLLWFNKKLREKLSISRFQIIDQKLYADSADISHPYFLSYVQYFQKFLLKYKIPNVDFIIYTRDEIPKIKELAEITSLIPSFMMFKDPDNEYESDKLLIPEAFILNSNWQKLLTKLDLAAKKYDWSDKKDIFFWRGATTGGGDKGYRFENIKNLPRLSLVMLSKLYPNIIDANFSAYMNSAFDKQDKRVREFLEILIGKKLHNVKEEDHLKYKYLISVDGNSCTGVRLPWIMYSNSLLIKQDSKKYEWFYSALKAYKNYIPVEYNFADIFEVFEWLEKNDSQAQQIAQNAHNFIQTNLMPEHIDAHMQIILKEYAKLQVDEINTPTLVSAEKFDQFIWLIKRLYLAMKRKYL